MCLESITKRTRGNSKWQDAWKEFHVADNELKFAYQKGGIELDKILIAQRNLIGEDSDPYMSGFHVWKKRPTQKSSNLRVLVVKVKVRKIRVEGFQWDKATYVADEMLVPRRNVIRELTCLNKTRANHGFDPICTNLYKRSPHNEGHDNS